MQILQGTIRVLVYWFVLHNRGEVMKTNRAEESLR